MFKFGITRRRGLSRGLFGRGGFGAKVAAAQPVFVSRWNTNNTSAGSSASNQITLPLNTNGSYNFLVNWGDGTSDTITAYNQAEVTHTYSSAGTYTLAITGEIRRMNFGNAGDKLKILEILQWGPFQIGAIGGSFYGCANLVLSATDTPNLTLTTSMANMFRDCVNLTENVRLFDVSKVTTMASCFRGARLDESLQNWNTAALTNLNGAFRSMGALTNLDISGFNVTGVTTAADCLAGSIIPTALYDALLISWESQAVQNSVAFHAGTSTYTSPGPAANARAALIADHSWTISDGGAA